MSAPTPGFLPVSLAGACLLLATAALFAAVRIVRSARTDDPTSPEALSSEDERGGTNESDEVSR